jgi:hypothetical protein
MRFPILGNGNRELGSLGDERSGLFMVEAPEQIWVIRFKEAACLRDYPFWEIGDRGFGSSIDKNSGSRLDKS